ncbi:FAD-dependent oxidoreductase [Streptomyces sp. A7024]|uniref:FAD-dependent oxidoreductase n=1 Tax=Streptomyces coryli TaxID=1128680 RepID=A0A6G4TRW7_9ACTN|nr:FAD-dependent oxidoreductase [Streptomyces coryli]NGN62533.1 FAD-dependent oxidoreductase [Streptomyces coryli]
MREETVRTDLTVVGGGLAGVCAAIAAARLGRSVALVTNRPVLGGNSSSEVRVWVCGATGHGTQRYARETGIMGELFVENQYRNPEGNPYYWDLVVLDAVLAEPGIQLFLNTDVREVDASGPEEDRRIEAVTGWMMGSERRIRFTSTAFADCTGDGLIGFLAGAAYRIGREARAEYGEPWAPETADAITLGSTLLFYTRDTGRPERFVPPSFAKDIEATSIPERRIIKSGDNGCAYWWIEFGGELDTVHDNERIRDELWAVIYGIWDYIKNSGAFDAQTMTLEWVGAVPGKREYRRFTGDYTLTQSDILDQTPFPDRVAFGGWSIDLHPPGGVYATESGSKHWHPDGNYHIPLRCLYSTNVGNLWLAGRDISASHVAFGSTRVMATCAVTGEAAGSAAALALRHGVSPRELARDHVTELQQTMLRQDAALLGVRNDDPADLARQADITASGTLTELAADASGTDRLPLDEDRALLVPVDPELTTLDVLLDADTATELTAQCYATGKPQNYLPAELVATTRVQLAPGTKQWIRLQLPWRPPEPQNAFVILRRAAGVSLHAAATPPEPGVLAFRRTPQPTEREYDQPVVEWRPDQNRQGWCFRLAPNTRAYAPERAVGGYARPYGGPQLWASAELGDEPQWLQLHWPKPVTPTRVELIFDDDVQEDLINLHHHRTPYDHPPALVRDFRIEAADDQGDWQALAWRTNNRRRRRIVNLPPDVRTDRLRLIIDSTHGSPRAHVFSLRVYG